MILAAGLAAAELAWARGDHEAVLTALVPVLSIRPPRDGIDEPDSGRRRTSTPTP